MIGALCFLADLSASASCGRRSSASAPFPVSTSVKGLDQIKPLGLGKAGERGLLRFEAKAGAPLAGGRYAGVGNGGFHGLGP